MSRILSLALVLVTITSCSWTGPSPNQVIVNREYGGVVSIRSIGGAGSGFVVSENNNYYYVATAAHVVDDGTNHPVSAPLVNGVLGEVVAYGNADDDNDIALIKVAKHNRRYRVYQLASTRQEARVRAAGFLYVNSMGEPLFSVYIGHVVNLNWRGFITVNSGVYPGMSGGPLFDSRGRVVGITSRCPSAWGVPMDTSALFVPAATLQKMLDGVL